MDDATCVEFLQWALPRLRMRWPGFRKVRRQVCKRVQHRIRTLELGNAAAYRDYLKHHPPEWTVLDGLCRITISRFYRDRGIFDCLGTEVLPALGRQAIACGETALRAWSAGCASGEEPYSLELLWCFRSGFPALSLHTVATDDDPALLERARRACYSPSSLKDLPHAWRAEAFEREADVYCLRRRFQENVTFMRQDIRTAMPEGRFDLILCRNLVFTYFEDSLQRETLERLAGKIRPGGVLVLGAHESLPSRPSGWVRHPAAVHMPIFQATKGGAAP